MKKRKIAVMMAMVLLAGSLSGCAHKKEQKNELEKVSLSIWGSDETQDMLKEIVSDFEKEYQGKVKFDISIGAQSESTLADNVVGNAKSAADVFCFADDQLGRLKEDGDLLKITQDKDKIIEENGGSDSAAVKCALDGDDLYAYPLTASNGYFMFYNAKYFKESDVQSLDTMLKIASDAGKKLTMDWSSGWYIYSFFAGAGLDVSQTEDGKSNVCNWNATDTKYKGSDVLEAMLAISANSGFMACDDDGFKMGVKEGDVIAGVNGPWNAEYVKSCWGDDYRAVKLPTYTLKSDQVQMNSFAGYKLVGVNAKTKNAKWAMKLARWVSNEANQMKRFKVTGEGPVNQKAASVEEVQNSPAVKAMADQAPFAKQQRIAESFWNPATTLGTLMASGNPDHRDYQEILDEFVENVTQKKN